MPRIPPADAVALAPHAVLAAGIVAALLAAAFARRARTVLGLTIAAFALALVALGIPLPLQPAAGSGLLRFDGLSRFAGGLTLFASLCTAVLARTYFGSLGRRLQEFLLLLMIAALGCLVLVSSDHFVPLLLGIELIGIPLIAMTAYVRDREQSIEAGFKYLVLAGVSTAVLLFGAALLFADTGSLSFGAVAVRLARPSGPGPLVLLGTALLMIGLTFKLALVPFHVWAPDVFDGAPAPAAVFAATASKAALIVVLLRIVPPGVVAGDRFLFALFAAITVLSMFLGNLLALSQRNIKRLLAYATIAHNGSLLIAFVASGPAAEEAVLLYLVASLLTNLAAFGAVSLLSDEGGDADLLEDYAGLTWRRPWTSFILLAALLSLAGVPLTAGFVSKFAILAVGLEASELPLVILFIINIIIGAAYAIRIIMSMFSGRQELRMAALRHTAHQPPAGPLMLLMVPALLLFGIGIAPQLLLDLLRRVLSY